MMPSRDVGKPLKMSQYVSTCSLLASPEQCWCALAFKSMGRVQLFTSATLTILACYSTRLIVVKEKSYINLLQ